METKVTLGVTDGANIEILSGLEEGDVVSATPPNLVRGGFGKMKRNFRKDFNQNKGFESKRQMN